jgi:sugar fermentation stimulation protein A
MVGGKESQCFIPNPGRMEELLYPGAEVYLLEKRSETRKTAYNLVLVDLGGTLISVDSFTPNRVVNESIERATIPEFSGLQVEKPEYTFGESRLDFLLSSGSELLFLEVKSCTLVRDGVALFPDAPTIRGRRHLDTLVEGLSLGRAAVFFLIQRSDAELFRPNEGTDPAFADKLRSAHRQGVEVYAYSSKVTLEGVFLDHRVPVEL